MAWLKGGSGLAWRRLVRAPGFTATVALTLALGIAANVAVFSVIKGVLLEPLPFDQSERLLSAWFTAPGIGFDQLNQCAAFDVMLREEAKTVESAGLWSNDRIAVTGEQEPEELPGLRVSASLLPTLRVDAQLGRRFSEEDDRPNAAPTAMISDAYWQRAFGGTDDVLGKTLRTDGTERTIIGVLPPNFEMLDRQADILIPQNIDTSRLFVGMFNYRGVVRLAEGATVDAVNKEMDRLIPQAIERYPGGLSQQMLDEAGMAARFTPIQEDLVGNIKSVLWILLAAVSLVLLVACANVANLFLVRAEGRQSELALRSALGAGRKQLLAGLLGESVVLGLLGGVIGVVLAHGLLRLLVALQPSSLPRLGNIDLDGPVLLFALVISLVSGLLFGLLPAVRATTGGQQGGASLLAVSLKESGRGGGATRRRQLVRSGLVVAQIALGLMLLVASGLLLRSFRALQDVDPGFDDPQDVVVFQVAVPTAEAASPDEVVQLQRSLIERFAQIPGTESASAISSVAMGNSSSTDQIYIEGLEIPEGSLPPIHRFKFTSPGYFETLGIDLLAGRDLTWPDIEERRSVLVISEDLANQYFGSPNDALGKRIGSADAVGGDPVWREVVGVVSRVYDDGPGEDAVPIAYWPMAMDEFWGQAFVSRWNSYVVRSERASRDGLLQEIQAAVWAENPNLPIARLQTLEDIYDRRLARSSFAMVMLALASGVALLLGAIGIYSVISYIVSQRTREIGVRMALGANRGSIRMMMLRYGLTLASVGTLLGLIGSGLLANALSRLLFGVNSRDPLTYIAVALALLAITLTASLIAGQRAARVNPMDALRGE